MGSIGEETSAASGGGHQRKLRFLCLHGLRTSGEIMRTQVMSKWPDQVTSRLDIVFPDALCPANGKSNVEGKYPPPYYQWFYYDAESKTYSKLDECIAYVEDLMIKHGPFDGLMGFSEGASLTGALVALQSKGLALTKVPKVKYLVIMSGKKLVVPAVAEKVYPTSKMDLKSLHFIGEMDSFKSNCEKLSELFVDPIVIYHPKGHTVPVLDDKSVQIMLDFLQKMESDLNEDAVAQDACKAE